MSQPTTHIVIPDVQCAPDTPTDHLAWAGWYIGENYGGRSKVQVHCLGDWWHMASLSKYDVGKKAMEGRRYVDDVAVGNVAMDIFRESVRDPAPKWRPEWHFYMGNHEDRITRAANDCAQMDGAVSLDHLNLKGWNVHPFLEPVFHDGVCYSHYFYNQGSGRPYGGSNVETRLKTIGHSFTMGHQQGLLYGVRSTMRGMQHGLVCGSFYQHNEDYRGPQATGEWRGIVICHDVRDGHYDPMFVSLSYLERRYGKRKA